jgi:hypothetical protein
MGLMANFLTIRTAMSWFVPFSAALAVVGACGCAAGQSVLDNARLNLRLSADPYLIQDPGNPILAQRAAWRTQYDLQLARNTPYLLITNTSQLPSVEATTMTMTVGAAGYHFDWVRTIDTSPGVDVDVMQVDALEGGLEADHFELAFTGLVPGAFALMQLDIDPDDPNEFHLPDFRTVLFQGNGDGTGLNSTVDATLEETLLGSEVLVDGRFEDYPINGPFFVGPGFRAHDRMDYVDVFPMDLSGSLSNILPVPEPSTLALLALAAVAVIAAQARPGLPRSRP